MQSHYPLSTGNEYDSNNEWAECPVCRYPMLRLADYEIQGFSEFPTLEIELWEYIVWGWIAFLYKFIAGLGTLVQRKISLAAKKRNTLPAYPNSLVCPSCLYVKRQ
jgi:hypothetical protein